MANGASGYSVRRRNSRRNEAQPSVPICEVAKTSDSGSARFASEPFVYQHLEQRLVADALSDREFARLCNVRLRQAQRYLNAGSPVQLAYKARSLLRNPFLRRSNCVLLHELAAFAASPPVRLFRLVCELRKS